MRTEQLPQAVEREQEILSSCLFGDAGEVIEQLSVDDFYKSSHQMIFEAIVDLHKKGVAVDLLSLKTALNEAGNLEKVGGAAYIASLTITVPTASNIEYHANKVREKAILRSLLQACKDTSHECLNGANEASQIMDRLKSSIDSLTEKISTAASKTVASYRDLSLEAGDRYGELYKNKNSLTGIATGFYLLDSILCGLQKGDLIVLAARPSMGKTALALNIAGRVTGHEDCPVAIFSLEMSKNQLFDRQISNESGINLQKFRSGKFEKEDWTKIHEAKARLYEWKLYIDDSAALHYEEIKRRAWALKKKHGIKLVIIDHLQLVKGDKNAGTRDREIGSITAGLKALAKELNMPVLLLSQLNRSLETRPNPHKRPKLSDLRDSGNIEQDSDVIMFLYRPGIYEDKEAFPGHTELIVAKHRNGPTGMIKLLWDAKTTSFRNLKG